MKRITAILLAAVLVLSMTACGYVQVVPANQGQYYQQTPAQSQPAPAQTTQPSQSSQSQSGQTQTQVPAHEGKYKWAFYWYLCGSNLESDGACATYDLVELSQVKLPEDVVFVIETGGSKTWRNNYMSNRKLQYWVYDSNGLYQVSEKNNASMGDAETLGEFLEFARDNYPAEKTGLIFWNHGGGSVTGAAFDELYNYDSLSLYEMYAACGSIFGTDPENPPLEMVGFDTCLMATIDVAYTFSDIARYLVASEESEPGNGWFYTQWVQALANDTSMDGAKLGREICDAFAYGCQKDGTAANLTLSVTDLTKLEPLVEAYEQFGAEALTSAIKTPAFMSAFGRAAKNSENYGGNTKSQGYTNMVDLGDLAAQSSQIMGSSQAVIDALEDCIVYKVNGPYRASSTGLSCYYSYNGDRKDFGKYADPGIVMSPGDAFKYFYEYQLTGTLGQAGQEYIKELVSGGSVPSTVKPSSLPQVETVKTMGWEGQEVKLDKKTGTSFINLGEKADAVLSSVNFELFYIAEDQNVMVNMGYDNDIQADWEHGIFADNFRGVWGGLGGYPVYLELSNVKGDEYNIYSVPVLLNGDQYNLVVAYVFAQEKWIVLGATKGLDPVSGMSAKELRQLAEGDQITVLWKLASYSGSDDFEYYTVGTVTYGKDTVFEEVDLSGGRYAMVYEMTDVQGNVAISKPVYFEIKNGEIYTTIE
ncbi:MAG: clostripain [Firmicutes bacterium]|nr:clostripain [Bacillota bacterium]